jgi:hypothetical protein
MRVPRSAILVVLMLSGSALADPPRPAAPATDVSRMIADDCAIARRLGKTCVLDISAEDVGGKTPVADDVSVQILGFGKAGSLVRVRRDFIFEIVKSAEDL